MRFGRYSGRWNPYSQTHIRRMRCFSTPWSKLRKRTPTEIGRSRGAETSIIERKRFYDWKLLNMGLLPKYRARFGWSREVRIKAYGDWRK